MAERAFEVPSEVPRLIERAAASCRACGLTGAAERRFLEDLLVACATAGPGARVLLRDDEAEELTARLVDDGETRVLRAAGTNCSDSVDEPTQGPQSWVFDFAQQTVRELVQLRRELEETNHGVVALYSEIDSRRAAEDELRRELEERAHRLLAVDRRKDEFIAMLGHELRNPIATIEGAVQRLRELSPEHEGSEVLQVLGVLERHGSNVKRLLDDLLNVSRIKRGKVVLSRRPTELGELVRVCGVDMEGRAAAHHFEVQVPDATLWASADPARLGQVITNLLDNAFKYTPAGGHVALRLSREGEEAVLQVQDSGVGIENERIRSAFDAYVQFDVTIDRAAGGMGLGLAVVKSLVELHGGQVRAHSPGRHQGSTFEVRLPLLEADRVPARDAEADEGAGAADTGRGRRLLLVEDNVDLRELTARRLSRRGFDVREAGDHDRALALARAEPPDVLVTDIGLPGKDGFALARALRRQLEGRACVYVALSGYGPPRDEAGGAGPFDAYMVKPLDVPALLRLVARTDEG